MPEANWGRKETIIWPPHSPIYTFGAAFLGLVMTGLFVYLRLAFALSPLEQFYLPLYVKTSIAPSLRSSAKYQMLLMSDTKGHAWYAREADVAAGSTPQANAKPIPLVLSDSARQHGMIYLYRSAPNIYQNSALGSYLKQQVYSGASIVDLFQWPLIFGALALIGQLLFSIPKDIRRRKQMKYGRRLKGPILVTPRQFNKAFEGSGIGLKVFRSAPRINTSRSSAIPAAAKRPSSCRCFARFRRVDTPPLSMIRPASSSSVFMTKAAAILCSIRSTAVALIGDRRRSLCGARKLEPSLLPSFNELPKGRTNSLSIALRKYLLISFSNCPRPSSWCNGCRTPRKSTAASKERSWPC